jgi:hypothetical protein
VVSRYSRLYRNFQYGFTIDLSEAFHTRVGMRWCRYHQRFAGILALFALGLQLFVSFAHVHPEGALRPFDISLSGATSPAPSSTDWPNSPGGGPHNDCAICITIGLLGSALSGKPPVVASPELIRSAPTPPVGEFKLSIARFYSFRTRAPPVV